MSFFTGMEIGIGHHDLSNSAEDYKTLRVAEAVLHPRFVDATFDYDFMMIRLDGVSIFQPVELDTNNISLSS